MSLYPGGLWGAPELSPQESEDSISKILSDPSFLTLFSAPPAPVAPVVVPPTVPTLPPGPPPGLPPGHPNFLNQPVVNPSSDPSGESKEGLSSDSLSGSMTTSPSPRHGKSESEDEKEDDEMNETDESSEEEEEETEETDPLSRGVDHRLIEKIGVTRGRPGGRFPCQR